MAVGIWHRLDQTGRHLLPLGTTVLFMLVGMTPTQIPGLVQVAPPLMLMAVVYWAVHRPDLLRPTLVFLLGVLNDLLGGAPLGMTALVFVLAYWLLLTQRRFFLGNSFLLLWIGFTMVALGAAAVQWAVYSLMAAELLTFRAAGFQVMLATAVFPLAAWVLMRLHRAFLMEEEG
ncbi:rod shape-determining protein MreD [Rhodocista pekingensis]|uniref:Rod shape-determining protein MreD n=1 Tax=Rhodocista pekingensis TaxID=201185 RepID=A0ABW2KTX6_9PROT